MPDRDSVAVEVGQPGDRNSSIEGFSVTSALWRLKDRRFTPDKYTHKPKSLGVFLEVTLEPWGISRSNPRALVYFLFNRTYDFLIFRLYVYTLFYVVEI